MNIPALFSRYLFLNGSVNVPYFGTLSLRKESSTNNFAEKTLIPPTFTVLFDPNNVILSDHQIVYMAGKSGVKPDKFREILDQWSRGLYDNLSDTPLYLEGIGSFTKSTSENLSFESINLDANKIEPVLYTHIFRENIEHKIKVGEDERTNLEMATYFENQKSVTSKNKWVLLSLLLIFLSLVLIVYRFMIGAFHFTEPRYDPVRLHISAPTYRIP